MNKLQYLNAIAAASGVSRLSVTAVMEKALRIIDQQITDRKIVVSEQTTFVQLLSDFRQDTALVNQLAFLLSYEDTIKVLDAAIEIASNQMTNGEKITFHHTSGFFSWMIETHDVPQGIRMQRN